MENGGGETQKWNFKGNNSLSKASGITVSGVLNSLMKNLNPSDNRQILRLGHGDPSHFPCFYTSPFAEDAVVDALRSRQFNCYSSTAGILPARKAVAEYLSRHLPNKLSPDDIFLTLGCTHAIEVALSVLSNPGANILIPKPGFPYYEAVSANTDLEIRHFNLLPEKGWEVDLDAVGALADENTVAMVIINPGNPCGNVYSYEHLQKVAETAKKLGILVIADEVYEHLTFGKNSFIPMGVFSNIVPVLTLGSISKRWIVPGWRVGWLVTNDFHGVLQKSGLVDSIKDFLNISSDPVTFIQGALPQIFENTNEEFFTKIKQILRQGADSCYEKVKEIPCITCPSKPEGSMFVMVKLDLSVLSDIQDDIDFCMKLAKEENMAILPGSAVGMKNYLRITFAVEPLTLEEGIERIKAFCLRHTK
ncbi:tyrosine aminotransferase-like [Chenopodium quinoa]|uniref:tyrosine aminotransferase-like n=1 Tax=Chenopodium quinoa TaxID=63459 RepID=UPI000B791772|nr:tyrosine aminotransferase-like [Chenopodium quinoa]